MKNLFYILLIVCIASTRLLADDDDEISQITVQVQVPVTVIKPIEETSGITIEVPGQVDLNNSCVISSKTEGYITTYIGKGDYLRKGELVATVQNKLLKAEIKTLNDRIGFLKKELLNSKRKLENYRKLLQLGLVSKNDLINLKNEILRKRTELESLQGNLKRLKFQEFNFKIKSPCEGYVLRAIHNKVYINVGTKIAEVFNPKIEYLSLYVPFNYISDLKSKEQLKLRILDSWYVGKVKNIVPVASGNLVEVRIMGINNLRLPLNFKLTASILIKSLKGFSLPKKALVLKGNKSFVFTVKNGIAVMKEVKVLKDLGDKVLVSGALSPQDLIVVSNAYLLQNGTKVTLR